MAPFEVLYGRPCRSPACWMDYGEKLLLGPELVQQTNELVKKIQQRLVTAQSRQKSYADKRRRPLTFKIGDYVYLKVSPTKGISRFGIKGKLAPRYVGPFQISGRCGKVAYKLALSDRLSAVHNVFHVSQLKKCLRVPDHVIEVDEVELEPDLTYSEYPIRVLDHKDRVTRRTTTRWYKVQWNQHSKEEATWESEDFLAESFPDFFATL